MNCNCGKKISVERNKRNEEIALKIGTKKLDMCDDCWDDYCYHALTGQ